MVKMSRMKEVREVISVASLFLLYPKIPRGRDFKKFPKNSIIRHNNTFQLCITDSVSKNFRDLILAFPPAMCPLSVKAIIKFKRHSQTRAAQDLRPPDKHCWKEPWSVHLNAYSDPTVLTITP